jgi:hypothetical protein
MTLPTPTDALTLRGGDAHPSPGLAAHHGLVVLEACSCFPAPVRLGRRCWPAGGRGMLALLRWAGALGRLGVSLSLVMITPLAAYQVAGCATPPGPCCRWPPSWRAGCWGAARPWLCAGRAAGLGLVWGLKMRGVEVEPAVPGVYAVLYGVIGVMGAVMGTATATSFDQQMAQVTALTQALQRSNEHLEARVVERTRELHGANEALAQAKQAAESRGPGQGGLPGQHEPRDPHAAQRHPGLSHLLLQTPLEAASAPMWGSCTRPAATCWPSSTTSWT